jgi:hypothetical protein
MPEDPLGVIDVVRGAENGPGKAAWQRETNAANMA